jgi:hypothetical protein
VAAVPTNPKTGAVLAVATSGTGKSAGASLDSFAVPSWLNALGGLVHRHRDFWLWLGRFETSTLAQSLAAVAIRQPIYVCGLARSGSTLLHEVVAAHPGVATHRLKDYPLLFTPYWWRRATAKMPAQPPHERPHQDGLMISAESPDALEEMVWMAFFPRCHDPRVSNLLGAGDRHLAFESFYRAHIRKLLLAEGATRYAAKANYHVARLAYLVRLFPNARILLPVREPASHIASLLRQHRLFSGGQRKHRQALTFMQRTGHFEFGLDRRPINLGDAARVQQIRKDWAAGDEVRGLAQYWDMVYGYLARLLASDPRVREATQVVRFETLCAAPRETLRGVLDHCRLPEAERIALQFAPGIRYPTYYASPFSSGDRAMIEQQTAATAKLWGYST